MAITNASGARDRQMGSRDAHCFGRPERAKAVAGLSCAVRALARSRDDGNALVELALIMPILLTLVMGIWQLGIFYSDMIAMTQGVTAGAQVLQSDRLSSSNDPCADTYNAIINAAPRLVASNVTVTISMNGGTAITGNTCSGQQTQSSQGNPVTVKASLSLQHFHLRVRFCKRHHELRDNFRD